MGLNKEKFSKYQRWYHKQNSEKIKHRSRDYYRNIRQSCLEILGGKCCICGFSDKRALQVDHIEGGGCKEKKSTTKTYFKIVIESVLKKENKYQLLCANCNWIKRFEKNENRK